MKLKTLSLLATVAVSVCLSANAQLHFPSALTNELDQTPIDDSARSLIVLIHGWNPGAATDAYLQTPEWSNLIAQLKATSLAGGGWKLAEYHWETDANTGPLWEPGFWGFVLDPEAGYYNATVAAIRAEHHGDNLAGLLQAIAPDLRRVHFIAHSAGSWAAEEATKSLLAVNPYCVVEMTVLDPFIPDASFGMNVGLNDAVMNATASIPGSNRIYRLENYYSRDVTLPDLVPSTQEVFAWRPMDTNQFVDWGSPANYHSHTGPIQFYGDTVQASIPLETVPAGLYGSGCPFVYYQLGWFSSLFTERNTLPQITSQPSSQTVSPGDAVTLTVAASVPGPFNYQWYQNGSQIIGANGASYSFTASTDPPTTYVVRVGNANGYTFSEKAIVSDYAAVPTISAVSPATLSPLNSPQTITITGSNFQPSGPNASTLVFYDPADNPYVRTPYNVTTTSMQYDINVQSATGTWEVKVVNGGVQSSLFNFTVASVNAQLTGLSISGPASVTKNTSAQYTATAVYSDGTSSTVTPSSWSLNSGAPASISSSGQLSAGNVSANTAVTITATYTLNGITKAANYNINIVTGSTSYQFQELISNGTFLNGSSGWTLTGNFQADSRFSFYNNEPGYAYLANPDGSGGNNLSGTLSQTITIPANATSATLGYYYRISTTESGSIGYDFLNVELITGSGNVHLGYKSNADSNSSYTYQSFDLSAYKGQTVTVEFYATTDGSNPTIFRVDDVSVQVLVPVPPTPVLFGVGGPTSVLENKTAQYNAIVVYSDGSIVPVTPSWSVSGPATISSSGFLTAGSVNSDTPATVTATYSGFSPLPYNITIVNVAPIFSSLAISGPTSMNANSSSQYAATAVFSDGTSQPVSPVWSVISGPGSISSSGLLTVGQVSGNTTTTVSANYTIGSITRSASQQVAIVYVAPPPTFSSLSISGPSSVNENSTAQYSATAWFSDGSSQVVNPTWSVNSSATSISAFGLLSAGVVTAATPVNISASYTIGGTTQNASLGVAVNVVTATITPSAGSNGSISPNTPQSVNLGGNATFTASPTNGYAVDQWMLNGVAVQSGGTTFTLADVLLPTSVQVTFKLAPPLQVTAASLSNGMFSLVVSGPAGGNCIVQVSSNLVDWANRFTMTIPTGGSVVATETLGDYNPRYYRAGMNSPGPFILQPGPLNGKDIWTTSYYSYAPCSQPGPGGGLNDYRLRVGGWGDLYYSLLQFDLTDLPTNASSATLYLYCYELDGGGTPMYLDRITQAWDWTTSGTGCDSNRLWWADKPATSQWNPTSIATPVLGQWYAVDITTLYNAWQNGTYPNYGFQLRPVNSSNNNFDHFYSSDYTDDATLRPRLVITPSQ